MKLTIFSVILIMFAYSFKADAGMLNGVWLKQAMQTTATRVGKAAGEVKSRAGKVLLLGMACFSFAACDVNLPTKQIDQILDSGKLVSEHVDLDTHEGIIVVERGSLLTMQATPNATNAVIDVGMVELGEDGEWVVVDAGIEKTYLSTVQLAILDDAGEAIEGALMMWQQPEVRAEQVGEVAVFENLFVPVYLPVGAQLHVTGTQRNDGEGLYFDMATLEPSGVDLTIGEYAFVIETFPPINGIYLNYEPSVEGSKVDWYIHVWGDSTTTAAVSTVMPLQSYLGRPAVLMRHSDAFFSNLPDHYRVVTRVTTKGASEDTVVIAVVDMGG